MVRSKALAFLVATTLSVLASGCVLRSGPGGAGSGTVAVQAGNPEIVIANNSSESICYVNFSLSSDGNWGPDRLGASETIAAGASRQWMVPAGQYDIRVLNCSQNELARQMGIAVNGRLILTYP